MGSQLKQTTLHAVEYMAYYTLVQHRTPLGDAQFEDELVKAGGLVTTWSGEGEE